MTMILLAVFVLLVSALCDSARDKRQNHSDWRYPYRWPRWVPGIVRRKFQDRWHIVKQGSYLLPAAYIALRLFLDAFGALGLWWALGIVGVTGAGTLVAWKKVISKPEHWR
jgi:hypothetical protein